MGALEDKAYKAKDKANEAKYYYRDAQKLANKIAKTATGKELTVQEEIRAGKIIQNRRVLDTGKAAMRGAAMVNRKAKKDKAERIAGAVSGATKKKGVSAGVIAAAKKAAPKPKPTATAKPKATAKPAAKKPSTKK